MEYTSIEQENGIFNQLCDNTQLRTKILKYLDDCIQFWRDKRDFDGIMDAGDVELKHMAKFYIDAYQYVRISLFGKTLS